MNENLEIKENSQSEESKAITNPINNSIVEYIMVIGFHHHIGGQVTRRL